MDKSFRKINENKNFLLRDGYSPHSLKYHIGLLALFLELIDLFK